MTAINKCLLLADYANREFMKSLLRRILTKQGYILQTTDELTSSTTISAAVVQGILDADLVVADLTSQNPNVFYELGLAHGLGKRCILVIREDSNVPFDLSGIRVWRYYPDKESGFEAAFMKEVKTTKKEHGTVKSFVSLRVRKTAWELPLAGDLVIAVVIHALQENNRKPTLQSVSTTVGLSKQQVLSSLNLLVTRGIVVKEPSIKRPAYRISADSKEYVAELFSLYGNRILYPKVRSRDSDE